MVRFSIAALATAALALAGTFTFTIGSPVASQDFRAKTAAFVFRTEGCADPAKVVPDECWSRTPPQPRS